MGNIKLFFSVELGVPLFLHIKALKFYFSSAYSLNDINEIFRGPGPLKNLKVCSIIFKQYISESVTLHSFKYYDYQRVIFKILYTCCYVSGLKHN